MWKPVKLDRNICMENLEGLIGIEECTNYSLEGTKNIKYNTEALGIGKKKKSSKEYNTDERVNIETRENLTPSKTGATTDDMDVSAEVNLQNLTNVEAWDSFGLPKVILAALKEQNFIQPTVIQSMTLPAAILGRRDILGAAETGSGKTLAFGLPILTGILNIKEKCSLDENEINISDSEESDYENLNENNLGCVKSVRLKGKNLQKPLYALILTPTRELAMQVKNHLVAAAKYTGINIAVVIGGMAAVKQERILSKGPEIVVATPGRLWELIQLGNDHLCQVNNIRFLAIDETDRMLERGHFQELQDLLERINLEETKKKQRQNFVFSATLTLVHQLPRHLVNKSRFKKQKKIADMTPEQKLKEIIDVLGITDPKVIDLSQGTGTPETLTECRITCAIDEKDYYVYYFLKKHPGRTLIFCNSIGCVKRLTTILNLLECNALPLHASMQQRQRLKNLERFRDTEHSILIATDVAARGLDIPKVEHVLHYQTPRTSESYVHRSGRTARASKQGITVLIMEPNEFQNYVKLCRTLGKGEDLPLFPIERNYLNAVKQRVNLARELDKLQLQVRKVNSEVGWFQKAAEEMDIVVDELSEEYNDKDEKGIKKVTELKRRQLSSLIRRPIFPKGVNEKYPLGSGEINVSKVLLDYEEKAVDVMRNAIENDQKQKKKNIPLYKPKQKDNMNKRNGVVKVHNFKKRKTVRNQTRYKNKTIKRSR